MFRIVLKYVGYQFIIKYFVVKKLQAHIVNQNFLIIISKLGKFCYDSDK